MMDRDTLTALAQDDKTYAALKWWDELQRTSNESFLPLFFDQHRYLVLRGGGGSGKSIFAGRKVLERVTSEPGHRWLVVRKVARTLRDSCFAQLRQQISDHYPAGTAAQINVSDMRMTFSNGSEIIFVGLDDVEKLKSIYDITGIWVEEASEITEQDFNQLDIRLRTVFPHYLQIILTFNPISAQHWLKKRFWDRKDPRATTHESTYKDNRFLPQEAADTLEAFKDTDPYYYMVYCLNQWGVTGHTIFNAQAVTERLAAKVQPIRQGLFTYTDDGLTLSNIAWHDEPGGPIKIYVEPDKRKPYVIGGDTAGDGSDSFVGQVLDNTDGRQVAVLRHQYDSGEYARQMYCLGMYYNTALIGIESNFDMYPIKELERLRYPSQYVRETIDSYTGRHKKTYGFRTTSGNRETIISALVDALADDYSLVCDADTLDEMLTFVRNERMRAEAQAGAHDDCIMALAIAHYIRPQQRMTVTLPGMRPRRDWTDDMKEDYRNASPDMRAYLLQKWGERVE